MIIYKCAGCDFETDKPSRFEGHVCQPKIQEVPKANVKEDLEAKNNVKEDPEENNVKEEPEENNVREEPEENNVKEDPEENNVKEDPEPEYNDLPVVQHDNNNERAENQDMQRVQIQEPTTYNIVYLKLHQCDQCEYWTFKLSAFTKHIALKHTVIIDGCKKILCNKCPYLAGSRCSMRRHILHRHTDPLDINWFNCKDCSFRSKTKEGLTSHYKIKHLSRQHPDQVNWKQCEYCPYKTLWNSYLKKHVISRHELSENIIWFKCEQCDYQAKHKCQLNGHKKRKHPNCKTSVLGPDDS
ncbi:LAP1C and/or Mcm10 domain containing protein, partial [Asbolus verrucosus]